jgi:hypothetical protein
LRVRLERDVDVRVPIKFAVLPRLVMQCGVVIEILAQGGPFQSDASKHAL